MKKIFLGLVILFYSHSELKAQFSVSDSAFLNSLFVENLYINNNLYSNSWFNNDSLSSLNDLYVQIEQQYPFYDSMLLGAYSGIQFNGGVQYNTPVNNRIQQYNTQNNSNLFGTYNPFIELPFELGGIQGKASALLDTGIVNNNENAFIIFTGTGDNQLTRVAVNANDYHNLNCEVRYHLKQKGDVYIPGQANEDNRAIHFNKMKLGRYYPVMPTFLHDYLNNKEQSMGINHLIETIAWVKYLKTKYQRVYILGLSSGGTEALWVSLLTQPKGTMVSSGYSVLFDTDSLFQTVNGYFYGNCMNYFLKDTVKKYINNGSTYYYFTQSFGDLPIFQQDSIGNFTPAFFAGNNKFNFVSNYYDHAFPPCGLIDTFLNHIPLLVNHYSNNALHVVCSGMAESNLHIEFGEPNKKYIEIFDISGRGILKQAIVGYNADIDCRDWAKGVYLMNINSRQGRYRQKVVKY
jgi:hypothetical protein